MKCGITEIKGCWWLVVHDGTSNSHFQNESRAGRVGPGEERANRPSSEFQAVLRMSCGPTKDLIISPL
ncbi:unnamed protein product [Sympodiomycopsis kandeliae]